MAKLTKVELVELEDKIDDLVRIHPSNLDWQEDGETVLVAIRALLRAALENEK